MLNNVQSLDRGYGEVSTAAERNKVLRNTYWLLALSLVPTVLGAWLGVAMGLAQSLNGGVGLVVFGRGLRLHLRDRKDQKLGCWRASAARLYLFHGAHAVAHDRHGIGLQEWL